MTQFRLVLSLALVAAGVGCKEEGSKSEGTAPSAAQGTKPDPEKGKSDQKPGDPAGAAGLEGQLAAEIGVEPGGIEHENEGAAAVVTGAEGTVEVRRLGEEQYEPAKKGTEIHEGDLVRTQTKSTAQITLVDETVVELADDSAAAIGNRSTGADPASSVAVIAGAARFSVSGRAKGEGAFRVYTPGALIVAKGTVFAVAVAASGQAQVGVEEGTVEVAGLAKLDQPVTVDAGMASSIAVAGEVAAPAKFDAAVWGAWRDQADAKLEAKAVVTAHGEAMTQLRADLEATWTQLDSLAQASAELEAKAIAAEQAGDATAYGQIQADYALTIDASFLAGLRAELLTWSLSSHAYLAGEIYVRNPDVEVAYTPIEAHVAAAVLYPKRLYVVGHAWLTPLRAKWYIHHPEGRAHATLVGFTVPEFYANVKLKPIPPGQLEARLGFAVYVVPAVTASATGRVVFVGVPKASWHAKVSAKAAPPAVAAGWYVRPATFQSKLYMGVAATAKLKTSFAVRAPQPVTSIHVKGAFAMGGNAGAAVKGAGAATGNLKGDVKGKVDVGAKVEADVGGKLEAGKHAVGGLKADIESQAGDARGKLEGAVKGAGAVKGGAVVSGKVSGGASAGGSAGAKEEVKGKVKAPDKPNVEVKGGVDLKAKGGIKIGK